MDVAWRAMRVHVGKRRGWGGGGGNVIDVEGEDVDAPAEQAARQQAGGGGGGPMVVVAATTVTAMAGPCDQRSGCRQGHGAGPCEGKG